MCDDVLITVSARSSKSDNNQSRYRITKIARDHTNFNLILNKSFKIHSDSERL